MSAWTGDFVLRSERMVCNRKPAKGFIRGSVFFDQFKIARSPKLLEVPGTIPCNVNPFRSAEEVRNPSWPLLSFLADLRERIRKTVILEQRQAGI
jgi:hypothetical protein